MDGNSLIWKTIKTWIRNLPTFFFVYFFIYLGLGLTVFGILLFAGHNYYITMLLSTFFYTLHVPQVFPTLFPEPLTPSSLFASILLILIAIALSVFASALVVRRITNDGQGKNTGFFSLIRQIRYQLWSLFGVQLFLTILIYLLSFVVWFSIMPYLGSFISVILFQPPLTWWPFSNIFLALITAFFVILVITLCLTPFYVIIPVIVCDESSAFSSFGKSVKFVRGYFKEVFTFSLIIALLTLVIEFPLGFTLSLHGSFSVSGTEYYVFFSIMFLQAFMMGFSGSILPSATTTMYLTLEEKAELPGFNDK